MPGRPSLQAQTIGIDLNPAIYTSPVVIGAGVTVSNTGYPYAVYRHSGATTFFVIDNDGTIAGNTVVSGSVGVYLAPGGSVTNAATASITGAQVGVRISGGAGTVVTYGNIAGYPSGNGAGVDLRAGGSVTNGASAHITSPDRDVYISGGPGIVVNDGSISGGIVGVDLLAGGSVTNGASAHIAGVIGVSLYGTLTNAGSIIGSKGTAVEFGGTGSNLLVLDAGFGFSGLVAGGTSSSNSIELASGSSTGTVTGMGSEFIHFGSIAFDAGARWFVSGIQRGLAGPITGFAVSDTIELTGVTATGSSFVGGILTLDLVGGGSATLNLPGTFTSASDFDVTNVAAGADVTVVCFLAGTHILTESGEIKVEDLVIGEHVITHSGEAKPIKWIGVGKVLATRGQRSAANAVIVRKGALGLNVPTQDLRVTKGHALYIDGVLIPVEHLINQRSILWDDRAQEVQIYHIELETHDVLIANGAPAESYRDDGNRWLFRNGNSGWNLPPQGPCAPLLTSGPVVDAIWRRLLDRAGPRPGVPLTDDPDLHLLVDGDRVEAASRLGAHIFHLPSRPSLVRIVSRAGIPSELGLARDPRLLGIAVQRIALRQGTRFRVIEGSPAAGSHATLERRSCDLSVVSQATRGPPSSAL